MKRRIIAIIMAAFMCAVCFRPLEVKASSDEEAVSGELRAGVRADQETAKANIEKVKNYIRENGSYMEDYEEGPLYNIYNGDRYLYDIFYIVNADALVMDYSDRGAGKTKVFVQLCYEHDEWTIGIGEDNVVVYATELDVSRYDNSDLIWKNYNNEKNEIGAEVDADKAARLNNELRAAMTCLDTVLYSIFGHGLRELGFDSYSIDETYVLLPPSELTYMISLMDLIDKTGTEYKRDSDYSYMELEVEKDGILSTIGHFKSYQSVSLWSEGNNSDEWDGITVEWNPYSGWDSHVITYKNGTDNKGYYIASIDCFAYTEDTKLEWKYYDLSTSTETPASEEVSARLDAMFSAAVAGWDALIKETAGFGIADAGFSAYGTFADDEIYFEVDGFRYLVDHDEVTIVQIPDKSIVLIPESVNYRGKTYRITDIAPKAAFRSGALKELEIRAKLTNIGEGAFQGCKKLAKITLNSSALTGIGDKAFKNISKKAEFHLIGMNSYAVKKMIRSSTNRKVRFW